MTTKPETFTEHYARRPGGVAWTLLCGEAVVAQGQCRSLLDAQEAVRREIAAVQGLEAEIAASLLREFGGRVIDAELIGQVVKRAAALVAISDQLK